MRKKYILVILSFILVTAPGAVDSWLSLIERINKGEPVSVSVITWQGIYSIVFPILGLAVILFGIWWTRPNKTKTNQPAQTNPKQPFDSELECNETLQHVIIEGQRQIGLSILRGLAGWPVNYPILIRNCRPHTVELVGYNVTILWDGTPMHRLEWRAPSSEATNGLLVHPPLKEKDEVHSLTILADDWYCLDIPVNMIQIPNWPVDSPRWTARGVLMFQCGEQTRTIIFDFKTDNYYLSAIDWESLKQNIRLVTKAPDDKADIIIERKLHHNSVIFEIENKGKRVNLTIKGRLIKDKHQTSIYRIYQNYLNLDDKETVYIVANKNGALFSRNWMDFSIMSDTDKVLSSICSGDLTSELSYYDIYPTMRKNIDICKIEIILTTDLPVKNDFGAAQIYTLRIDKDEGLQFVANK